MFSPRRTRGALRDAARVPAPTRNAAAFAGPTFLHVRSALATPSHAALSSSRCSFFPASSPMPTRRCRGVAMTPLVQPVYALAGRSDDGSRDEEFRVEDTPRSFPDDPKGGSGNGPKDAVEAEEKNELFEFVKTVPPPELVARFANAAPPVVQKAIRQTIVTMLGSLPITAFSPSVQTVSANIVQLFHSSLISGYMFRNAAYRLELSRSLGGSSAGGAQIAGALPGAEPEIRGGVAVFKSEDGADVEIPVEEYVNELRQQVDALRDELTRERKGGNELLSYISTLEPENLDSLTSNAGEEVVDAMKRVVAAVTTAQGIPNKPDAVVDASSFELGQLLFYLMVSGFFLREAEVRVELQRSLGGDTALNLKNLMAGSDEPGSPMSSQDDLSDGGDDSRDGGQPPSPI